MLPRKIWPNFRNRFLLFSRAMSIWSRCLPCSVLACSMCGASKWGEDMMTIAFARSSKYAALKDLCCFCCILSWGAELTKNGIICCSVNWAWSGSCAEARRFSNLDQGILQPLLYLRRSFQYWWAKTCRFSCGDHSYLLVTLLPTCDSAYSIDSVIILSMLW